MLKSLLIPILLIVAATTACSDPTPTQDTTAAATPPAPTEGAAPTIPPAPTAAPTATPAPTQPATGVITPLSLQDTQAMAYAFSSEEMDCFGGDPAKLASSLAGAGSSMQEQAELIECLNDETVARIFLAGFVPDSGPLSLETSACIRAAFTEIDPRAVMTAGLEGDPAAAMAGSMIAFIVTLACLTQDEWESTAPRVGMDLDEQEGMVCVLEELGGPAEMAAAMIAANEGGATTFFAAAMECGLDTGPAPSQVPATPTETPLPTNTPVPTLSRLSSAVSETAASASSTVDPAPQDTGPAATSAVEREDGDTPLPEGVSPALVQDAQMYAEQYGVELGEAVPRLMLQEPAGKLGAALREHEGDTFACLWIQHEPEFAIVAVFTRDGQETVRQYIQGGPLEELVEVRHAEAKLRQLMKSQAEAHEIVSQAGFQVASGINVFENRVELYADNPAQLGEALKEKWITLPDHVLITRYY